VRANRSSCYTNHALDQFLENIHSVGVKKIIRIGGHSKSSLLDEHNLRKVAQAETKTRSENYFVAKSFESLERETKSIRWNLNTIHGIVKQATWPVFKMHLFNFHPHIYAQFDSGDKDGFQHVGGHPFELWKPNVTDEDQFKSDADDLDRLIQRAEHSVYSLSRHERHVLLHLWSQEIHDTVQSQVFEEVKNMDSAHRDIQNVHDEVDRRVLQSADVIGITTTGLAKRIATLQRLRCKVVICEEAGEVMEPHLISALLPTLEHFIQIGDHEQLRPQINMYTLSLESKQG
jgi:hypothetical protein